jgi:hypothetical protein
VNGLQVTTTRGLSGTEWTIAVIAIPEVKGGPEACFAAKVYLSLGGRADSRRSIGSSAETLQGGGSCRGGIYQRQSGFRNHNRDLAEPAKHQCIRPTITHSPGIMYLFKT